MLRHCATDIKRKRCPYHICLWPVISNITYDSSATCLVLRTSTFLQYVLLHVLSVTPNQGLQYNAMEQICFELCLRSIHAIHSKPCALGIVSWCICVLAFQASPVRSPRSCSEVCSALRCSKPRPPKPTWRPVSGFRLICYMLWCETRPRAQNLWLFQWLHLADQWCWKYIVLSGMQCYISIEITKLG